VQLFVLLRFVLFDFFPFFLPTIFDNVGPIFLFVCFLMMLLVELIPSRKKKTEEEQEKNKTKQKKSVKKQ